MAALRPWHIIYPFIAYALASVGKTHCAHALQGKWFLLEIGFARWEADKVWDKPSDD
jgi:hypothetical protein